MENNGNLGLLWHLAIPDNTAMPSEVAYLFTAFGGSMHPWLCSLYNYTGTLVYIPCTLRSTSGLLKNPLSPPTSQDIVMLSLSMVAGMVSVELVVASSVLSVTSTPRPIA